MSWLMSYARKSAFLRVLIAPVFLALGLVAVGVLSGHEAPITIVTEPADQIASPGKTATFTAVAINHGRTLSYQWFNRNPGHHNRGHFVPIPSAMSPSYTTPILSLSDNGLEYFVRVSSGREKAESRHARLTVKPTITIVSQPADQVASPGQTATFTVAAITDAGTLHYQWFYRHPCHHHHGHDGSIPGANSSSYTTPVLNLGDSGSEYFVHVTDSGARAESRHALLTVVAVTPPAKPVVTLDPYVTTGKAGLVASTQDQGAGMTYVWTLTGGIITSGQGTPAIRFTAGTAGTLLTASVRVSNLAGSSSGSASATVVAEPNAELALPISVHPGDGWMKASVPIQPGMTYLWTVIPGTSTGSITSGQGTGVIKFSAGTTLGTFQIQADVQNQAGDHVTANRTITVQTGTWLIKNGGPSVARTGATATLLPSGRVLMVGGYSNLRQLLANAEVYDPATGTWSPTGNLTTVCAEHTATLLPNGQVLIAGGYDANINDESLACAEIYNPATGTWVTTGSMGVGRRGHTATLLPNGKVLVTGGLATEGHDPTYIASAEIFDPTTGTWTFAGDMGTARHWHTATLLANGQVLVAGGSGWSAGALAEIYDPITGTWTATGHLGTPRSCHTATLLLSGKVLVVGGQGDAGAEIYDPETGIWTPTESMEVTPSCHTATLLANGKVLVAGGYSYDPQYSYLADTQIYDPASGTWTRSGNLGETRYSHIAFLLPNEKVLVAGGTCNSDFECTASAEIYDPATGLWMYANSHGTAREYHTANLLANGNVLVAGGCVIDQYNSLASAEIYDPTTQGWTATGSLGMERSRHTATMLSNGKVLVAGGVRTSDYQCTASAEIYDPAAGVWTPTNAMGVARYHHTATLLPNGQVLVAGGYVSSWNSCASAEVYDPVTGTWTPTSSLGTARWSHTATLLPNGKVLVAGGGVTSAEVYDPEAGTWAPTGSTETTHLFSAATLLPEGKVLLTGGSISAGDYEFTVSAEIYDSRTGIWAPTNDMGTGRMCHTATLLPNGEVLVAGGVWGQGAPDGWEVCPIESAEIFDTATGAWTPATSLGMARWGHTATLLNNGTVMVAFGKDGDVLTEIYMP